MLDNVYSITASLTDDYDLKPEPKQEHTPAEVIAYLQANPRHAVVIHDLDEESGECEARQVVYISRDAADEGYYVCLFIPEDAEFDGGDDNWLASADDALAALSTALDELSS